VRVELCSSLLRVFVGTHSWVRCVVRRTEPLPSEFSETTSLGARVSVMKSKQIFVVIGTLLCSFLLWLLDCQR